MTTRLQRMLNGLIQLKLRVEELELRVGVELELEFKNHL